MMLIPFLNEIEELREKMQVYFEARGGRRAAGYDSASARVLGVYHVHVGESSAKAREAAAHGLHEYHLNIKVNSCPVEASAIVVSIDKQFIREL